MKNIKSIVQLIFVLVIILGNFGRAQVCNTSQIHTLLKLAEKDSIQKIERLAALKFHKIINEYREENKLDTIAWDEAMWLTCRNHNIWMGANNVLSHDEKSGTIFFTGTEPGDRYKFTTNDKGKSQWSGENALYNYTKSGKNINEIASNMALIAFEQWKHSPGHNKNMLGKRHQVHGLAFYLNNDGRVYATDLFASNIDKSYNNSTIENTPIVIEVNTLTPIPTKTIKRIRIDVNKIKTDLVHRLYAIDAGTSKIISKKNKAMEKASSQHSEYMSSVKQLTHNELKNKNKFYGENEEKRMIKATHGLYLFAKHKIKLTESIAILDIDVTELDINKLAIEIQSQLDKEKEFTGNKVKIGYGVTLKRTNNNLKFYITRIVGNRQV